MPQITLCHINDIEENQSKGFTLNETNLFAVKRDGLIYAYKNSCPHLGIELQWQEDQFLDSEGSLIQCSTHGALFLIDNGDCVAGPCLGKSLITIEHHVLSNGNIVIDSDALANAKMEQPSAT